MTTLIATAPATVTVLLSPLEVPFVVRGLRLRAARVARLRGLAGVVAALGVRVRQLIVGLAVHVLARAVLALVRSTALCARGAARARVGLGLRVGRAVGGEADLRGADRPRVGRRHLVVRNREREREADGGVAAGRVALRGRRRRRGLRRGDADGAGSDERLRGAAGDGRAREDRRERDRRVRGEREVGAAAAGRAGLGIGGHRVGVRCAQGDVLRPGQRRTVVDGGGRRCRRRC